MKAIMLHMLMMILALLTVTFSSNPLSVYCLRIGMNLFKYNQTNGIQDTISRKL